MWWFTATTGVGDDNMGWQHLSNPSVFVIFIREKEVTKNLTGRSKADAFIRWRPHEANALMGLTGLKPKEHYELTVLTNVCLSSTYRVYKEITCSPRFAKSKGIPIRKGSRKIRLKEIPKRKGLLIPLGEVHALLL